MLELSRTVRLGLSPDLADDALPRRNTFSAWPPVRGLGRYLEVHVTCRGEADPRTGYFINIKDIDTAVREHALPVLRSAVAGDAEGMPMGRLLDDLLAAVQPALGGHVAELGLQLSPFLSMSATAPGGALPETSKKGVAVTEVLIRQQYEFSAAHRLHVPELSDAQNRATFGKCNNPAGHGHNYRVQVAVAAAVSPDGRTLEPAALDAVVDEHLIDELDHQHLNEDVPAFAELNPSVENIVRVAWDMLADPLAAALPGCRLDELTVWETGKTSCTYRGPEV
jgi:6-pyruvoyltetrahydropterin/6-carboxytetrahydropterin synthase